MVEKVAQKNKPLKTREFRVFVKNGLVKTNESRKTKMEVLALVLWKFFFDSCENDLRPSVDHQIPHFYTVLQTILFFTSIFCKIRIDKNSEETFK